MTLLARLKTLFTCRPPTPAELWQIHHGGACQ